MNNALAESVPQASPLTHAEFRQAYGNGSITVQFDPARAARYISARLLLPLVMMPVLGVGVALALTGWVATGLTIIALGIIVPRLIKRNAPGFLIQQALNDERIYQDLLRAGIIDVVPRAPA